MCLRLFLDNIHTFLFCLHSQSPNLHRKKSPGLQNENKDLCKCVKLNAFYEEDMTHWRLVAKPISMENSVWVKKSMQHCTEKNLHNDETALYQRTTVVVVSPQSTFYRILCVFHKPLPHFFNTCFSSPNHHFDVHATSHHLLTSFPVFPSLVDCVQIV